MTSPTIAGREIPLATAEQSSGADGKRHRVLVLIKGLGLGGAERLIVDTMRYRSADRFDYQVAYFLPWKDALVEPIQAQGVPVRCLGSRSVLDVGIIFRLVRYLRRERIELLHCHLSWTGIVGRLAGRIAGVSAIVYTEHGCWDRQRWLSRQLNQATLSLCDAVIAVSEEVRHSFNGCRCRRIVTIPNGVDCDQLAAVPYDRASVCSEFALDPTAPLLINVANLSPIKNHELLIESFARLLQSGIDANLLVVGQWNGREQVIRQVIHKLGIQSRVRLTGPRVDVPRLMKAADAFVLSSRSEGQPISLLEAMALGKACVAPSVGGIPGLMEHEVTGLLVQPNDPDALVHAMRRVLVDRDLNTRLASAAKQRANKHHSIRSMVQKVEGVYHGLLGIPSSATRDRPSEY